LYTQSKSFQGGKKVPTGIRENYFSSINQFLIGISPGVNMGFDLWIKTVHIQSNPRDSPLRSLRFTHPNTDAAITGLGPKIKLTPFNKLNRLSIQSTLLFPLRKDLENRTTNSAFLEFDRSLWINQIFYDKSIGDDFQLFFQVSTWTSFTRDSYRENNFIETPVSVFFSWFVTDRFTTYVQNEYWPSHYNDQNQSFNSFDNYFIQSGLGLKYQLIPGFLELESLYSNFWAGSDFKGAGETYNLGIRIIN
jgi:hypothetical protein